MNNKKKKIIISCLLGIVVCLGVGFAAFSTTLKINGSAKVSPDGENYKVFFASSVTSVTEYSTEDFNGTSVPDTLAPSKGTFTDDTTFTNDGVTFTEDGQSIDYKFYILNAGKYDAHITNLDIGKKTCTPGNDADPALAASACSSINLSVILGDEGEQTTYTSSQAISEHVLPKGTWEQIIVRITYPEGSPLSDGELEVNWKDINIITATNPSYVPPKSDNLLDITGTYYTIGSFSGNYELKSEISKNKIEYFLYEDEGWLSNAIIEYDFVSPNKIELILEDETMEFDIIKTEDNSLSSAFTNYIISNEQFGTIFNFYISDNNKVLIDPDSHMFMIDGSADFIHDLTGRYNELYKGECLGTYTFDNTGKVIFHNIEKDYEEEYLYIKYNDYYIMSNNWDGEKFQISGDEINFIRDDDDK